MIAVELKPELEEWLRREAAREGVTPEEIAARAVEARWAVSSRVPRLTAAETDLLAVINDGFSEEFWQRFRRLLSRLQSETLTETERQEFIRLNAEVEGKNVRRMAALAQLAARRGITLPEIMQQLGVGPVEVP